MKYIYRVRAKGQVTTLVALLLGLGVLMGFVALAFDGSSALLQRRNMQNGADASALAAVQFLGNAIVWDEGRYAYLVSNQDLMTHIATFLASNRGGVTGQPTYRAQVDYGTYIDGGYTWSTAANYTGSSWTYETGYPASALVPFTVDAVRVIPGIDNPTTFARVVGISSIPVGARAAAALVGTSEEVGLNGPTWPITRCQFPTEQPPVEAGICRPYLFWSARINDAICDTNANFKSLLQLGAHQGRSYEGTNLQLLTQADPRIGDPTDPATRVADATALDPGSNNYESCVGSEYGMNALMNGWWSPKGNCTDPAGQPGTLARECCSSNASVADVDVNNFVMSNFQGRISLTATTWPDINGGYSDRRSADHANEVGDWIEVYNGGGLGNNIQTYFARHVAQNGQSGPLSPYYGRFVSKVLYLYDDSDNEIFDYPPGCNPQQEPCSKEWQQARSNDVPQRVHMTQAFVFQFYERLVDTNAPPPVLPPSCDPNVYSLPNVASSQVYGMFAGLLLPDPPPGPGPHTLYNHAGYIDPGQ